MIDLPLVSVIIPIYKVEQYLPQCVESVLKQTYENLQIILIDDGSPNDCGKICDNYAMTDCRIQVIHKENGGLSDARNVGAKIADGEFIYYLDSDDYIDSDTIRLLVEKQHETNVDIVMANYYYTYSTREEIANLSFQEETLLNNYEAMKALVRGEIETFAWGKLIKTSIAKRYDFPKGKQFEDHYWTHFVFGDIDKLLIIPQALVHYRQREGSISFTYDINRLDVLEGWLSRKQFLEKSYPDLVELCMHQYASHYVVIAWLILTRMKSNKGNAFKRLREYNSLLQLQNFAEQSDSKLICALDKGNIFYTIMAVAKRIFKR